MKTFRQIREQADLSNTFEKAKLVANYIPGEKAKQRYIEALDQLVQASNKKEIYNARYNESKQSVTRGIEYAYSAFFDQIKDDVISAGHETLNLWSMSSLADIKKVSKIYDKMKLNDPKVNLFIDSVREIPDAIKSLKAFVKSGREPKAPKPGQFVKPVTSVQATKNAVSLMTKVTESFKKDLYNDIERNLNAAYDKIKNITDPKKLPKEPTVVAVATTIFMKKSTGKSIILELIPNADQRINKLIDDSVNNIVDGFIAKNSSKLAQVLQKKDAPTSSQIIRTNIRNGKVENTMKFTFSDGSAFTLDSIVVYKRSPTGKLFFQYPTRFKGVILPDGSKMRSPSEEKMIKEF